MENSNYSLARRKELKEVYERTNENYWAKVSKHTKVKAFIKEEHYPEYKPPRGIYSRSDAFKVQVGPMIYAIEKEVFKHKNFVKKIPVADRGKYIEQLINVSPGKCYVSDYSSYEKSFTPELMHACAFVLYDHMMSQNTHMKRLLKHFKDTVSGINVIEYKNTTLKVIASRMSGEMDTSLGNGFTNLMVIKYLAHVKGCVVEPAVEGDDAVFISSKEFTKEDYAQFGLICKLQSFDNFYEGGFCGIVTDPETMTNITDPFKVIMKTPYVRRPYVNASEKVLMALTKSKALSALWTYPGAPIIQSFAKYLLRCSYKSVANFSEYNDYYTRSFNENGLNIKDNKREDSINRFLPFKIQLHMTPYRKVKYSTRLLMQKMYKVTIDEQIAIEKYFDKLSTDVEYFYHDYIYKYVTDCQKDYFETFIFNDVVNDKQKFCDPVKNFICDLPKRFGHQVNEVKALFARQFTKRNFKYQFKVLKKTLCMSTKYARLTSRVVRNLFQEIANKTNISSADIDSQKTIVDKYNYIKNILRYEFEKEMDKEEFYSSCKKSRKESSKENW